MRKPGIVSLATLILSLAGVSAVSAESTKPKSEAKAPAIKNVKNVNCPIGGGAVGSMQEGSHVIYKGYRVGLCCDGCSKAFNEDPDKYLKIAREDAAKAAKEKK